MTEWNEEERDWNDPEAGKPRYRTKTGRVLTDADLETLADEAEQGYDVSHLIKREARIDVPFLFGVGSCIVALALLAWVLLSAF